VLTDYVYEGGLLSLDEDFSTNNYISHDFD
jgi:hypothetical protein